MNEWQVLLIISGLTSVGFIVVCELLKRQRDQWEKNSDEWKKIATAAIAECLYWRRLEASRSSGVYCSTESSGITATQISDKVH